MPLNGSLNLLTEISISLMEVFSNLSNSSSSWCSSINKHFNLWHRQSDKDLLYLNMNLVRSMAILLNFGASCDRLKTVSRRIPEMNVKGWHSSFNIALELLKTPLEVVTTDPALGYQTATKLLKDRFGHPFKIATAHVIQVTRGPAVKPNDQRGLKTFADQLQDCKNVLEPIGYLDEVNSADNLSIVCPSIWKLNGLTLPAASKSPVSVLEFIIYIFQSSSLKRPALLRIPSLEVRLIVTKTKVRRTDQVRRLVL